MANLNNILYDVGRINADLRKEHKPMTDKEIFNADYYYTCSKIKRCSNRLECLQNYHNPRAKKTTISNMKSNIAFLELELEGLFRRPYESEG